MGIIDLPALIAIATTLGEILASLWALTKFLAVMAGISGVLYILFTEAGHLKLGIFVKNVTRAFVRNAKPLADELLVDAKPAITAIVGIAGTAAADIKKAIDASVTLAADSAFNNLRNTLYEHSNVVPEEWPIIAGAAFGDAASWGLTSAAVTGIFESMFPEKLNALNILGPMFSKMAGFDEVTHAFMRPIMAASIARPAQYDANAQFRSLKPTLGQGMTMYSRRKIDLATLEAIEAWAGLAGDMEDPINAMAFRPISPRALATAIQDTPFPRDQMRQILQDNGLKDADVQFMLDILEYNSTKNVRQTYVTAVQSCYQHGAMSDQEFHDSLAALGWSDTAIKFATDTAALHRRITLASKVEAQIIPLVTQGLVTPDTGTQQLEAAGIQAWYADLEITLATTKAAIHAARLEATAEQKLATQRQRQEARASIAQYHAGTIDAAQLAGLLTAAGMDPIVVAAIVTAEQARKAGSTRLVYGQILAPTDAKILVDRVNAIGAQLKKELIDVASARAQLTALNLDAGEQNAILARWAAEIGALTKHGILLNPETGA